MLVCPCVAYEQMRKAQVGRGHELLLWIVGSVLHVRGVAWVANNNNGLDGG